MTDQSDFTPDFLRRSGAPSLAFSRFMPDNPVLPMVVFLGGFRSDMQGTKALFLEDSCRQRQQPFIRFDYRGHGQSEGLFEDGTIGLWFQDALDVIDHLTRVQAGGPIILVGSSMGGWIGLLVARARPDRVKAFIGIAAAPDFTQDIESQLTPVQHAQLATDGVLRIPNHYSDDPYVITRALIEDGRQHFLLDKPLELRIPVRLVQGMKDNDVPWQAAFRIKNALCVSDHQDVEVLLIEEGNHRLSRPEDLALINAQIQAVNF